MGATGNSPKKIKAERSPNNDSVIEPEKKTETAYAAEKINHANIKKGKPKQLKTKQKSKKGPDSGSSKYGLSKDIAEQTEEYLQKFFLESFGKSSSKVFDIISTHGQLKSFKHDDNIVTKGENGKGVFVILKGKVRVTTSDSTVTIETLQSSDLFGEMSSIYDIPSTANVVAMSETEVSFIPKMHFMQLLEEFDTTMDIIDWCIHRRYLPTSDLIDSERAYRRLAFTFLRKVDFFIAWPDNALKTLILSLEHRLVLLYPAGSMITIEGDPLNSLLCIIKGKVTICRGPREVDRVAIHRQSRTFMFGESGLYCEDQTASVSLKAQTVCQVILVPKGNILKVIEEFPALNIDLLEKSREQQQFIKRLGHLYKQYEPDLQTEVLVHTIEQSGHYADKPEVELRNKVRHGVYKEFNTGSTVFLDVERDSIEAFLVIRGEVELPKVDDTAENMLNDKHILSERTVVVLADIPHSSVKVTCPSLILKIPKYVQRPVQEHNNLELV